MSVENITINAFKNVLRLFLNRQAETIELQIEMLNKSDKSLKF
jgi:chaperonin cofactor prefoldin